MQPSKLSLNLQELRVKSFETTALGVPDIGVCPAASAGDAAPQDGCNPDPFYYTIYATGGATSGC